MNEKSDSVKHQVIDTRSFTEKILGVPPCEEILYQSYFQQEFWSLEEFCILMGGLSPQKYKNILTRKEENITKKDLKRIDDTLDILGKVLHYFREIYMAEGVEVIDDKVYMTTWKYIKLIAIKKLPVKERFFDALPFYLKEMYLEFLPTEIALRTASHHSRQYHKAYYLSRARQLMKDSNQDLTPTEIYNHSHMQHVQRHIRALGGNYKKRTILESWLPSLENRSPGRPKKSRIEKI